MISVISIHHLSWALSSSAEFVLLNIDLSKNTDYQGQAIYKMGNLHSTLLQGFLQFWEGEITSIRLLLEHLIVGRNVLKVAL
jgi:hypothetical protein